MTATMMINNTANIAGAAPSQTFPLQSRANLADARAGCIKHP
jgi:hypothetical protein